jgi:hypothetical protein
MKALTLFAALSCATAGIYLSGCSKDESVAETTAAVQAADHGHDHGADTHTHDDHGHDQGHGHGAERELGSLTFSGTTLKIILSGVVSADSEVPLQLLLTDGPMPSAVRLWIGDEAGTGALKSKADALEDSFHAHVETPSTIDSSAALWIEVESSSGEREAQSVSFN